MDKDLEQFALARTPEWWLEVMAWVAKLPSDPKIVRRLETAVEELRSIFVGLSDPIDRDDDTEVAASGREELTRLADALPDETLVGSTSDQVTHLEQCVRRLLTVTAEIPHLNWLRHKAQSALVPLESGRVKVGILGSFNAGKSSLINALLGRELLPTGIVPVTASLTHVKWAESPVAAAIFKDGTSLPVPFDRLAEFCDEREKQQGGRDDIDKIEIGFPADFLREIEILDTPGFNSGERKHDDAAERVLGESDVVLWVFNATKPGSETERVLITHVRRAVGKVIGVVNKIDGIHPTFERKPEAWRRELDGAVEDLRSRLGELVVDWIPVSAAWMVADHPESGRRPLLESIRMVAQRGEQVRREARVLRLQELDRLGRALASEQSRVETETRAAAIAFVARAAKCADEFRTDWNDGVLLARRMKSKSKVNDAIDASRLDPAIDLCGLSPRLVLESVDFSQIQIFPEFFNGSELPAQSYGALALAWLAVWRHASVLSTLMRTQWRAYVREQVAAIREHASSVESAVWRDLVNCDLASASTLALLLVGPMSADVAIPPGVDDCGSITLKSTINRYRHAISRVSKQADCLVGVWNGDPESCLELSRALTARQTFKRSSTRALRLLENASESESPAVLHELAHVISQKDLPRALSLIELSAKSYAPAMVDLGDVLIFADDSSGVSYKQALEHWERAKSMGDLRAQSRLEVVLRLEPKVVAPSDWDVAVFNAARSALEPEIVASSDTVSSRAPWSIIPKNDYASEDTELRHRQPFDLYESGRTLIEQGQWREAARYFKVAADKGNAEAMYELGGVHYYGYGGFKRDKSEALRWYRFAMDNGNSRAAEMVKFLGG